MSQRSMSQEFDPRIAEWLEGDPDGAPDAVLETVLAAFPSIPQRRATRVPSRPNPMNRLALFVATAVGIVLIGGALLVFRPGRGPGVGGPSPAAIPSSATVGPSGSSAAAASSSAALLLEKTFTSALYGYTVDIPAGWTRLPAALEWTAGSVNNWASGFNDELKGTDIRFSGAAQVLAKGQTADDWLAAYASGGDPKKWPRVRIDGQIGSIDADGVPALGGTIVPGGRMYDAVVVSRNVAFNFNMDGNVDRATFDAFLATVKLPALASLDQVYSSAIAGFSVNYPTDWSVMPATKPWRAGYEPDSTMWDTLGNKPSFTGTSTRLPTGMSFETWYAAYDAARGAGTCGAAALEEPVTVDRVVGRLDAHCPDFYLEAVVPTSGRVYILTLYAPVTRPEFRAFLDTIHLTPATAKN